MLIKDRVAVITGIGPGMGREIALAFAQNGAKLAIGARNIAFVDKVARSALPPVPRWSRCAPISRTVPRARRS